MFPKSYFASANSRTHLIPFLQRIEGWRLWLLTVVVCTIFAVVMDSALSLLLRGEIEAVSLLIALISGVLVAAPAAATFTFLLNTLSEFREQTLQNSVQRAESRLSLALEATRLVCWEFDIVNDKLLYDDHSLRLLDMDETDAPHHLQGWLARVHPDDIALFMAHFYAALPAESNSRFDVEYRIAQRSQTWGWLHSKGCVIQRDPDGVAQLAVGTTLDITARKRAETELREAKEKFELIFNTHPNAMLISRLADGRITDVNEAFTRSSGYTKAEAINNTTLGLKLWTTVEDREKMLHQLQTTGCCNEMEAAFQFKDGKKGIGLLSAVVTDLAGVPHVISTLQDITERKKLDNLVWNQANYDPLTDLPNRRMFGDRLTQDIKKAHRAGLQLALLFVDLDHFKEINDTLGHDMGDRLLVEAARRITSCVRESDTVARLGGDEFTIILAELEETLSVERIAANLIQILTLPYQLGSETAYISASIGITLYPDDATDLETLLKNADQAMYVSKNSGRNRYSYFTLTAQQATQSRQKIKDELHLALQAGQFRLFYQPIVELASGRIRKAEALIRWQHPKRGILSPAEFIPLAEDSGLIRAITDWLFRESLHQVEQWQQAYGEDFQISINLPSLQFQQDTSAWLNTLKTTRLAGRSLVFEIRESVLLDPSGHLSSQLTAFREAGIQAGVEGFSGGSVALAYLKKFALDYLKMDAAFTRNLSADSSDLALTRTVIAMAHKLGLQTIAMGVETRETAALLKAAGCDYGQGYLYSRPVPADEFERLLKSTLFKST